MHPLDSTVVAGLTRQSSQQAEMAVDARNQVRA
jgi:hypothetical protein